MTSSSFTIFGWFTMLMLLTSQNSFWIMENISFVLLMDLMATTPLVVHAE